VNEEGENLTAIVVDMAQGIRAKPSPYDNISLQMGRDQGQHSGFENCIMRYDDSRTFEYRDREGFRFWQFNEPLGKGLCTTGVGSGVNDENRKDEHKQARYGPALSGRGDCLHQIHVTDVDTSPWRHKEPRQPQASASHDP
jgi:hypothetical protein